MSIRQRRAVALGLVLCFSSPLALGGAIQIGGGSVTSRAFAPFSNNTATDAASQNLSLTQHASIQGSSSDTGYDFTHTAVSSSLRVTVEHVRAEDNGRTAVSVGSLTFTVATPVSYEISGWYATIGNRSSSLHAEIRSVGAPAGTYVYYEQDSVSEAVNASHALDDAAPVVHGSRIGTLAPGDYILGWSATTNASAFPGAPVGTHTTASGEFLFEFFADSVVIPLPQTAPLAALGLLLLAARGRRARG